MYVCKHAYIHVCVCVCVNAWDPKPTLVPPSVPRQMQNLKLLWDCSGFHHGLKAKTIKKKKHLE